MPTTPVAPSAVPDFPPLSDRVTYNARAYAWAVHMDVTYGAEMFALANVTHGNAAEAVAAAASAAAQVALAAAQVTLAQAQANAAVAAAGAVAWLSGITYAIGDARYSPLSLQTYRRKTAGAGTTDPSLDATNWAILGGASTAQLHAIALSF